MIPFATTAEWILGFFLALSSFGIILAKKPVYASLSFLLTLFALAGLYLQLSAEFIAIMQILVYAGAILVIFIFVIILFQDAHEHILLVKPQSSLLLLLTAGAIFIGFFFILGSRLLNLSKASEIAPKGFGEVETLGRALYLEFFFPFEAVVLLFLVAVVGALYLAKKDK